MPLHNRNLRIDHLGRTLLVNQCSLVNPFRHIWPLSFSLPKIATNRPMVPAFRFRTCSVVRGEEAYTLLGLMA